MKDTIVKKKVIKKVVTGKTADNRKKWTWGEDRNKDVRKILVELPLDVHKKLRFYAVDNDLTVSAAVSDILVKFLENS